jgi:endonuclease V-like protein UPF0215 family
MSENKTQYNRIIHGEFDTEPIDGMVDEIQGSIVVVSKVLFAGFNIVFLIIIGVILVANFGL